MFLLKAKPELTNKKANSIEGKCENEQFDTVCVDNSNDHNTSDADESDDSESEFVNSALSSKDESLGSGAKVHEDSQDPGLSDESLSQHADNEPLNDLAQYWRALEATRYYGMRAGLKLAKHTSFHTDLDSKAFDHDCGVCDELDCIDSYGIPDEVRKSSKLSVIPEQGCKRNSDSIGKKFSYRSINFEDMRNVELDELLADDVQDILQYRHKISGDQTRYSPQTVTAVYSVEVPLNSAQGPFGYRVRSPKLPWKSPLQNHPFNSRIFKQQRLLQNDIQNFDMNFRVGSKHSNPTAMEGNSKTNEYKYRNKKKENENVQDALSSTAPPQLDTGITLAHPLLQRNKQNDRCSTVKNNEKSQIDDIASNRGTLNGTSLREYEMAISKVVLTGGPMPHIPTSALLQLSPKVPPNLHDRLQALKSNVDKSRVKSRSWYRKNSRDGIDLSCSTVTCSSTDAKSTRRDDRLDDGDCSPDVNTLGSISTETIILDKQPMDAEENVLKDLEKCDYKRRASQEKDNTSYKIYDDKKYFDFVSLTNESAKNTVNSQQNIEKQIKHCFGIESSGEISEGLSSLMQSDRSATSMKLRVLARKHCAPDSDMKLVSSQKWAPGNVFSMKNQATDTKLKRAKRKVFEYSNIHYDSDYSSVDKQGEIVVNGTKETAIKIESEVDKDEISGYSHVTTTGLGFISHRDEKKIYSKLSSHKSDNLQKSPENSLRSTRSGKRNVSINSQLAESEDCITLCTIGIQAALSSRSCDSKQIEKHNKSTNSSESSSMRGNAKGSNDTVYLDTNSPCGRRLNKKVDNIERSKRCILELVERALNKELVSQENGVSVSNDVLENNVLFEAAATINSRTNSAGPRCTTETKSSDDEDLAASPLYIRQLQEMRNNQIRHIQQEVTQLESLNRILDAFHPASPTTKNRGEPI